MESENFASSELVCPEAPFIGIQVNNVSPSVADSLMNVEKDSFLIGTTLSHFQWNIIIDP